MKGVKFIPLWINYASRYEWQMTKLPSPIIKQKSGTFPWTKGERGSSIRTIFWLIMTNFHCLPPPLRGMDMIRALCALRKIRWKENSEEKKWEGKKVERKSDFPSCLDLEKDTMEEKKFNCTDLSFLATSSNSIPLHSHKTLTYLRNNASPSILMLLYFVPMKLRLNPKTTNYSSISVCTAARQYYVTSSFFSHSIFSL